MPIFPLRFHQKRSFPLLSYSPHHHPLILSKTSPNLTKPYQNLTKPYKNLTQPCQNLTKPDQTMHKPYQTSTKPYQTLQNTTKTLPKPYQTLPKPHHTLPNHIKPYQTLQNLPYWNLINFTKHSLTLPKLFRTSEPIITKPDMRKDQKCPQTSFDDAK